MWRCCLLLCSTIVIRLMAGLATAGGLAGLWIDLCAPSMSWILPLAAYELIRVGNRGFGLRPLAAPHA